MTPAKPWAGSGRSELAHLFLAALGRGQRAVDAGEPCPESDRGIEH